MKHPHKKCAANFSYLFAWYRGSLQLNGKKNDSEARELAQRFQVKHRRLENHAV